MINLQECTVLPPGVATIFLIRNIQRLQLFPMTPYIVLVGIKVVRNYVINNFELHDQLLIKYIYDQNHNFQKRENILLKLNIGTISYKQLENKHN